MSVSASVRVSQSKGFNGASSDPQGRHASSDVIGEISHGSVSLMMSDVTACFSPTSSTYLKGAGGTERPPPVRKARPSSLVRFFSTKRGGQTRPSASRTPAQTPLGRDASEERRKKSAFITSEDRKGLKCSFF